MCEMERGARIIIKDWVRIKPWDRLLIVTSKEYRAEARELRKQAFGRARSVNVLLVENKGRHVGMFLTITKQYLTRTLPSLRPQSIPL